MKKYIKCTQPIETKIKRPYTRSIKSASLIISRYQTGNDRKIVLDMRIRFHDEFVESRGEDYTPSLFQMVLDIFVAESLFYTSVQCAEKDTLNKWMGMLKHLVDDMGRPGICVPLCFQGTQKTRTEPRLTMLLNVIVFLFLLKDSSKLFLDSCLLGI